VVHVAHDAIVRVEHHLELTVAPPEHHNPPDQAWAVPIHRLIQHPGDHPDDNSF